MILYNPNELEKLQKVFPDLDYIKDKETIEGELKFCSRYKRITCNNISKWDIEPCDNSKDDCVEGPYSIRINIKQLDPINQLPTVFETGGRIKKVDDSCRKSLNDLHLNNHDESCCLGILVANHYPTLYDFVTKAVYPYFVWQAYLEKYKKIPPCGECPHNSQKAIAIRISEEENNCNFFLAQQTEKPSGNNRNKPCLCDSGKKYKKCCLHHNEKLETKVLKAKESIFYLNTLKERNLLKSK